ncbi:hypothetical protein [Natronococcus occultus]|uniref:Uncharacterized protein n=1 Tax=Natronococcus occultus SP4 TaxID=694430 RepID=L0K4D2_9EURY|nr:hypothetical protein [Natronococcus occultus]AGB39229.1 hypothetical protein Natoc_3503 [Natronococcus occultus SP4]
MFDSAEPGRLLRNLGIYTVAVLAAIAGAIGLIDVIDLPVVLAGSLLVLGLAAVLAVHEYLGGPF